ncbi:uncharacterized protein LOC118348263 [Juglans regia]|uniref:Uncharacterized protein LOC118348263 n=1 Tax=Juglans regia TaxID=51240 RepID=A0A6P9ES65_JUGRE|nr:uncharacterized protein LOC118348263 [Juglans regia]
MRLLAWNCRGIARSTAIRSLRAKIRIYNPDVIFLSETLLSSCENASIVNRLGFTFFVHSPPTKKWGGLLLLYRPGFDIELVNISANMISALVYSDPVHVPWLLNLVYCPAAVNQKQWFWDMLSQTTDSFSGPSLAIGDFNSILSQSEKFGGKSFAQSSTLKGLPLFMNRFGFVDIGFNGPKYTWSNKRAGFNLIKERLDRGIANLEWIELFPNAYITTLTRDSSDHAPILLDTSKNHQSNKSFKFEEFWLRDPSIFITIKKAWSQGFIGTPSFILSKKLKNTKKALRDWNLKNFGHIQAQIKHLSDILSSIQDQDLPPSSLSLEMDLQTNLQELLIREETLWRQKSRVTWLTTTDLNTKFFHASTVIRRRRNMIDCLKTGRNQWSTDPSIIATTIQDHFQKIFTSSNPSPSVNMDHLFPRKITDVENDYLCHIPTDEEIFLVVKALPSSKAPGRTGSQDSFIKNSGKLLN